LTDTPLAVASLTFTVLVFIGTILGYRAAKVADHPPLGWLLVDAAFGLATVRGALSFYSALMYSGSTSRVFADLDGYIGVGVALLVLFGVYYLYTDFKDQMRGRQAELMGATDLPAGSTESPHQTS